MKVHEWMTSPVHTVRGDTPIDACARILVEHGVRHLPVVDVAGELTGVVSDLVVLRQGVLVGERGEQWMTRTPQPLTADQVMVQPDVICVRQDAITACLSRLAATPQDFAVVVSGGRRPIGMFTEQDAVRYAAKYLEADLTTGHLGTGSLHVVQDTAPAQLALDIVRTEGVRHVPVLREGVLIGVLSVRDLLAGGVADGERVTAGELLRPGPLHTLAQGSSLRTAAFTMAALGIGCLPLLSVEGRPLRIVTRTDLIAALEISLRGRVPQRVQ